MTTENVPPHCICPRCGSNDTHEIRRGSRFGRSRSRRECRACGRKYSTTKPATRYAFKTAMRCRVCGQLGRVTSTRQAEGIRWWKCDGCKSTWKEAGTLV